MLDETFTFKGSTAKSKGIELQKSLEISPAIQKQSTISIPGRSGDLHYYEEAFYNRTIRANCFILSRTLETNFKSINAWLLGENGYFKFVDVDNTRFYLARATSGVTWNPRVGLLNPFELSFDCKPQHFLETGDSFENISILGGSGSKSITNPTAFKAYPVFKLNTNNSFSSIVVSVSYGNYSPAYSITFSGTAATTIEYDTELQMIVSGSGVSAIVTGDADGMYIPGSTSATVSISGGGNKLTYAKIKARWWDI